jgi:hypothetical protein
MAARRLGLFAPPDTGAATGAPLWTPARAAATVTPAFPATASAISVATATPKTPLPLELTSPAYPIGQRRI